MVRLDGESAILAWDQFGIEARKRGISLSSGGCSMNRGQSWVLGNSFFRQLGVTRAESIEESFDIAWSCVVGTRPATTGWRCSPSRAGLYFVS